MYYYYGMKGYPLPPLVQLTNYLLIDPPKDSPSVWPLGNPFAVVTRSAITDSFLCIRSTRWKDMQGWSTVD